MGEKEKEVLERIKRLENEVSELSGIAREVRETLSGLVGAEKTLQSFSRDVVGVPYTSDANPWALEASKNIMETRKNRSWISSARVDTYKLTLNALKCGSKWLSAEEVGEKTGRKRNTESTYLNRLYRAGLIEQKTEGSKTQYRIRDRENLVKLFGKI